MHKILKLISDGDYEEAKQLLSQIPPLEIEKEPELLFASADCRYESGNIEEAARLYGRYVELHPGERAYNYALYNIGLICLEEGDYSHALSYFEKAGRSHPGVSLRIGEVLCSLGRYSEALQELLSIGDVGQESGEAYWYLGIAYNALSEHEKALSAFVALLEYDAENADVYEAVATELLWLERYAELETLIESSFDIFGPATKVLLKLAAAYNSRGGFHDAVRVLKMHLSRFPNDCEAWVKLGINIYMADPPDYAAAKKCFEAALAICPDDPLAITSMKRLHAFCSRS